MDEAIERARELVRDARRVVVLTGAGISTASGIPDFRGPDGVWTRDPDAQRYASIDHYVRDPDLRTRSWRWRAEHPAFGAEPNAAHQALVDFEATGRLTALVTQNVDGLHLVAGSSPDLVHEVHGNMRDAVCMDCDWTVPLSTMVERVQAGEGDPRCDACGGIAKSATVFFGQALPLDVWDAAERATTSCDCFVAIGTTLEVHPVAGLAQYAAATGASLIIVNRDPTPSDGLAAVLVREDIERAVPAIFAVD